MKYVIGVLKLVFGFLFYIKERKVTNGKASQDE